jgi:RNA polymerase sigma-70 factor (ECF subfamily)
LARRAAASPRPAHASAVRGARARVGDALLAKVAGGDHAAFASLYDHMASAAYGIAHHVVRNAALAEEITQDAFLQVWSTGATFDSTRGSARSWILTIVHRRAVDVVCHEQTARDRALRAGARSYEQPFDSGWSTAVDRDEEKQVHQVLKTITLTQRRAIEMAYYCGMTCGEVARAMGIPVGTVKSRILEGMRCLRRVLATADRDSPHSDLQG